MLALEEKNNLSNELQSTKKRLEEIGNQKVGETYWPHLMALTEQS